MAERRTTLQYVALAFSEASVSRDKEREAQLIYRRTLPGGGFVAIATRTVDTPSGSAMCHGEVVVERRTESDRRDGHVAPVVASADGATTSAVFQELFPIASSNPLLAAACMRQSTRRVSVPVSAHRIDASAPART